MRLPLSLLCVALACALHAAPPAINRWEAIAATPDKACADYLRLAKAFNDVSPSLAFYFLEDFRRGIGDKAFDAVYVPPNRIPISNFSAYAKMPPNIRTEAEVERHLRAAAKADPLLARWLGIIDANDSALKAAGRDKAKAAPVFRAFLEAVARDPELAKQEAVCQFLAIPTFRILKDPDRAKPFFITLYFGDPHLRLGEFAEHYVRACDQERRKAGALTRALKGLKGDALARKALALSLSDPGLFLAGTEHAWFLANDLPAFPQTVWIAFLKHPLVAFRNSALETLLKTPDWTPETLTAIRSLATSSNPILRQQYALLATRFLTDDEILARLHNDFPAITADTLKAVRILHPKATPQSTPNHTP